MNDTVTNFEFKFVNVAIYNMWIWTPRNIGQLGLSVLVIKLLSFCPNCVRLWWDRSNWQYISLLEWVSLTLYGFYFWIGNLVNQAKGSHTCPLTNSFWLLEMVNLESLKLLSVDFVVSESTFCYLYGFYTGFDSALSTESCICGRRLWSCWRWSVGWWWR